MTIPTLVAHRGHAAGCPENTLPALEEALAAGAAWVELDVQLSSDLVPHLFHDRTLERIADTHRVLVIDFADVTLVDSSAANMIEGLARKARRRGVAVYLTGTTPALRRTFLTHGARPPLVRYVRTVEAAVEAARRRGQLPLAA